MNVYDFDNTIYDGESAVDFFLCYLKTKPELIKFIPKLLRAIVRYKRGKITVESALSEYGPLVTRYYTEMADPNGIIKTFWDTHMNKIRAFYKDVQKEDDLIISCSPEISLAEISARLGISRYIGTDIDSVTGEIKRLCFRENKVKAFFEIYPGVEIENFYTDSMNDAPLMAVSKNVFLVSKKGIKKIK